MKIYKDIIRKSNADYAYQILKENILYLELKPGEELKEAKIAEALQMSRTPIREAIILLKHDKLIETFPQSGTFVTKIDEKKFKYGRMLRVFVETKILEMSCVNMTEEYRERLKQNMEQQEYVLKTSRNYREFRRLDKEFHEIIAEGAQYSEFLEVMTNNFYDYIRIRELNFKNILKDDIMYEGHRRIYEVIKNRTPEKAEEAIQKHYSIVAQRVEKLIEENPSYFQ